MSTDANVSPADAIQPLIDRGELAGAVFLAATREGVQSVEVLGYADLEKRRPMTRDTLFWIASTSKAITGAAIMMLVEEGGIDTGAPVENYLPEFKGLMVVAESDADHLLLRKPAHPITVREALTHTSGLPFRSPVEHPFLDRLPLAAAVRSHAMMHLDFEPGTRYQYSNAGSNTAARVIEVVTGQEYAEFMQERLFDPLGMRDTTFWPDAEQLGRLAKIYRFTPAADGQPALLEEMANEHTSAPLDDRVRRFAFPAGGLYSTADDCARFGRMIASGGALDGRRYLSEASIREMTAKQTAPEVPNFYGYGWSTEDGWSGHGGAYANNLAYHQDTGVVAVSMVQLAGATDHLHAAMRAGRQAALERFGI